MIDKDRLGKIVALAKRGVGGERTNAIKLVKTLCRKHGLDFDEVMSNEEKKQEFHIDCTRVNHRLLLHVVLKYAFDSSWNEDGHIWIGGRDQRIYFTTTMEKYVEVSHAFVVLSRLYKKEQDRVKQAAYFGFLEKHDLYATNSGEGKKASDITEEEIRVRRMGSSLAENMEDAKLHKTLHS